MSSDMLVHVLEAPGEVSERRQAVPQLAPGHCLIEVKYLGLCGTDLAFFDGTSNYIRDGAKAYPFVFGHEWSGQVVSTAGDVTSLMPGARVAGHNFRPCGSCERCAAEQWLYCPRRSEIGVLGAMPGAASTFLLAPANTLTAIPDTLGDAEAALLEPCSAAVHAIQRATVSSNDRVAVVGAGTLGLTVLQLAVALGARVCVVEPSAVLRQLALELGAHEAVPPASAPLHAFSVVIEASGSAAGTRQAAWLCGPGARLAQVGTPHAPVDGYPVSELVINNVSVHAVLSGVNSWQELLRNVVSGHVCLQPLIHEIFPRARMKDAFNALATPGRARPKILIQMS
ncbi:alcohol dehydrogenase catalytic domain-containing protein [Pendulispora brunnea]|uniref:Alcohol dehydrogenase catalytic domain-containing protein n=1 Tax=Pendulispora brunnea TaxID=2905690 RepID=A0ABZ2KEK7_9BACT